MPDTTEKLASTVPPARPGWGVPWVLAGLGFVIVGTVMIVSLLRSIDASPADSPLRRNTWLPLGFCAIFPLIGLSLASSGLQSIFWRRRLARRAAAHPGEPWLGEYEWSPEGERRGSTSLTYARFPFVLGEPLEVRLKMDRAPTEPIEARLRVIEERLRQGGRAAQERYQVYEDARTVTPDGSPELAIAFPLPRNGQGTDLGAPNRTWWELHLQSDGAGLDERFVVPVYRRP